MPELPEVEAARNCVERSVKGSVVQNIVFVEQGGGPLNGEIDTIVLGEDTDAMKRALLGKELLGVSRKGKYIWFEMKGSYGVLFHFGMTGSFLIRGDDVPQYKSFTVSETWPPKFTKLELIFSNGKHLAFVDPRRLGRAKVLSCLATASDSVASLARDPYTEGLPPDEIITQLNRYSAPIKSILLDQQKVCCGIGNYLADEVLYQSGIHPLTPANTLTPDMVHALINCISSVIRIAVDAKADYRQFPASWIFHHRWGKGKSGPPIITTAAGERVHLERLSMPRFKKFLKYAIFNLC
jgi:formamidopyrimidine-DNA glycosylase